ncbi:IS5 family transposase [Candidatus Protochlamydia amoebophila]|uniref:IS5 family transposase n=1 Tax=Candidatus Protochlamydia amoebophila TaxID=362787 RepID=UPI003CC7F7BC
MEAHRRHDRSDRVWNLLEPHLPGRRGAWGGIARDNRTFINAVFWILRMRAPWRDLPPDDGGWSNTYRRFIQWRNQRIWERLLEVLIDDPDDEWLVIDASHCQVHPHAAGAKGGNQSMSPYKRGLNTKLPLTVDAHGLPIRVMITEGTIADCTQARNLIVGLTAEWLMTDKGYDSDAIVEQAISQGMQVVIPPPKSCITGRECDKDLYKLRHLVENAFLHLKRWGGIATRYAKNSASFLAAVYIRCIAIWAEVS